MKKLLLSLSALMLLGSAQISAQITNNPGFDTWTANSNNGGNAPDPNGGNNTSGWWGFNVASNSILGGSLTLLEGTSNPAPEQGSHYAAIVSDTMPSRAYSTLKGYGFPYGQTNGIMFTGLENINIFLGKATFKSGVPISGGKLDSYTFYYRYVPNGSDSCSCSIALYHWNSAAKTRTLLGGGFWGSIMPQTTWTSVTVPVAYSPDSANVYPDTVLIIFSACAIGSANHPMIHDTLDIDNSSDVLGIANISAPHDNVNLYPNPAQTEINLAITGNYQANRVEVYDITGKAVGTYTVTNNSLTINTESYSSGLYIYKLLDNTGVQLNVGKFSVVK